MRALAARLEDRPVEGGPRGGRRPAPSRRAHRQRLPRRLASRSACAGCRRRRHRPCHRCLADRRTRNRPPRLGSATTSTHSPAPVVAAIGVGRRRPAATTRSSASSTTAGTGSVPIAEIDADGSSGIQARRSGGAGQGELAAPSCTRAGAPTCRRALRFVRSVAASRARRPGSPGGRRALAAAGATVRGATSGATTARHPVRLFGLNVDEAVLGPVSSHHRAGREGLRRLPARQPEPTPRWAAQRPA